MFGIDHIEDTLIEFSENDEKLQQIYEDGDTPKKKSLPITIQPKKSKVSHAIIDESLDLFDCDEILDPLSLDESDCDPLSIDESYCDEMLDPLSNE